MYAFLTLFALFATSMRMPGSDFPGWLRIVNMGAAVLLTLILLIFKDLPPLTFYLVTLVDGIALLLLKPI